MEILEYVKKLLEYWNTVTSTDVTWNVPVS